LTALQKSEAGVMRLGDDPEYVHSDPVPFAECVAPSDTGLRACEPGFALACRSRTRWWLRQVANRIDEAQFHAYLSTDVLRSR
jgi:hypothetical protein